MKKFFIFAAAALVALTACNKVETDNAPAQKVTFQAANYVPQTKAVSVLSDFTSFKSKAYLHAEGIDLNADGSVKTNSFQNFFGTAGETISPDSTTDPTEWAPSHTYYWPKGTKSFVNFIGWYGTTGSAASDPDISYAYDNTASAYKATLTWDFSNETVGAAGANLLYADMAWRFKANNDPATYGMNHVTEGVPMLFHHALAQINVKAYATGDPALTAGTNKVTESGVADWVITLENVKITPIHRAGTLTLTNTDPGTKQTQAWTGDWAGTDTAGDLTASNFTVQKVTSATAEDLIAATCVLPQTIAADDVVLSFNMRIVTTYLGTNAGQTNTELIPVSIKLNNDFGTTAWEKNHKYTYYVKIVPSQNKVLFDPALDEAWVNVPASDTTEKEI